jgi:tetratricopeptide (TPR) repeat protein
VDEHFFVSYSTVDAADFVLTLADDLAAGPPSYSVWVAPRNLRPGEDWDEQLVEALRTCRGVLFVLTEDSVDPESVCKQEWVRALKYKKPVIPLLLHPDAELPLRLGSRQHIDFSDDYNSALAQLRRHLAWTGTPVGVLQEFRVLRSDARRKLARVAPVRRPLIEREIAELDRRIAAQQHLIEHPADVQQQTRQRIETGLELQRQPERPVTAPASRARFVNPPPMRAPVYFQDREIETALVADYLRTPGLRMTMIVGRGGVGKTALVCRLLKASETGRLPDDLGELAVDGIVYLSPVGTHPVRFPNLFDDLCRLLPDPNAERLRQLYRDPQQTPRGLMLALLEAFPHGRSVVLLDNFEDIVDAGTGAITDPALDEALRALLTAPDHGVKVLITTRVPPRELLLTQPVAQRRLNLDEGLPSPHAENILRAMDPDGSLGLRDATDVLLTRARDRTRGYPRALEALAAILAADRDTTLPELLTETERLPDNVVHALVGEAFSRLEPLAQQVMQALAIYPVPVPSVAVDYLLQPYWTAVNAAPVLTRLVNMQFVRRDAHSYYLHQVDRDYALHSIPSGEPTNQDAEPPPFTQSALRHRGATYFAQTRTLRGTWKTLADLAPQLAEFELRLQSADYDDAAELLHGIDLDYLMLWGHYRLTIDLHQRLHGHLTIPRTKSAHLMRLGHCYANLGQVNAAIDYYQQALTIDRDIGNRGGEAARLGSLGNCYAHLGQISTAIDYYQQALTIDRDIGNKKGEATALCCLGNCCNLGQISTALDYYQQALTIDRDIGNRKGEAICLGNFGDCYAELGQISTAIDYRQQALTINRDIGRRGGESFQLANLGDCYAELGQIPAAIEHCLRAIEIADEMGYARVQCEARIFLARAYLLTGDFDACRATVENAIAYNYLPVRAQVHLLLGIAQLRQGQDLLSQQCFTTSAKYADAQCHNNLDDYANIDCKAVALCGLVLTGQPDQLPDAIALFGKARAITTAPGIVARTLRLFDAIAVKDISQLLATARSAAQGKSQT